MAINDEVGARLDQPAGPGSTPPRWLRIGGAVAVLVLALAAAAWWTGAVVPRLSTDPSTSSGRGTGGDRTFTVTIKVRNEGRFGLDVASVGRSGGGLRLASATGGQHLAPSAGTELTLTYQVTDCSQIPGGSWKIPVRVERPWGTATAWVDGPELVGAQFPGPWQQVQAGLVCQ